MGERLQSSNGATFIIHMYIHEHIIKILHISTSKEKLCYLSQTIKFFDYKILHCLIISRNNVTGSILPRVMKLEIKL